ncbi:MAG: DUF2310 family Zn-ribbon-containing protein [Clostridia bacterium]|nr:DUF2310 family Zn-ribbon-containing protein [Clostridia bacterium]
MYLVEFRFTPKKELRAQEDIATSRLSWFLMLCKYSGQIIGTIEPNTNAIYVCNVYTPMRESLDKKNDLPFVAKERANVEEFFEISYRVLVEGDDGCACENRSGIEMWTEKGAMESPFVCLSCGKRIPLYRLPMFEDGSFGDTLAWQEAFCSMIALNDTVYYDEFTSNELLLHTSKLNQRGYDVAKRLKARMDCPVYYRLHEIDETEKFQPREWVGNNNVRVCPACQKVMRRLPIADEETIEVCDECGYSSAEETEEIW